ncbi:MAG TPA: aminotransferase class V-fold PLP-dependent enzyme [Pyrinomonadaceae bacterium]|jgi:selenocysteine lyase/cysteine desulfurase
MTEIINTDESVIPSQRDLFEIPEDITYLNCASISPQLRSGTAAGFESVKMKAAPWRITSEQWFTDAKTLRELAAKIIGSEKESIAVIPSASYGIAAAAANARVECGQSIVLLDNEFPSNYYAWKELAKKCDASIILVQKSDDGETWTQEILEAINDNTAVVSVPNCHWTDGSLVDLEQVGKKARSVGAMLVVDASQSLGAYPLDLAKVQPDFLVATGYKWLLCPYSLCFMYVAPKWQETGKPIEYSWMNRRASERFSRLNDYTDEFEPGARRFDMGEFSNFVLVPMAIAALRQINEWGVGRIQQTLSALTNSIAEKAIKLGCSVAPPQDRVGHLIGIRLPNGASVELGDRLSREKIYVSIRGDALRIAPFLYNDERDIEKLFTVLQRLV